MTAADGAVLALLLVAFCSIVNIYVKRTRKKKKPKNYDRYDCRKTL